MEVTIYDSARHNYCENTPPHQTRRHQSRNAPQSPRNAPTGFLLAALTACQLTVSNATSNPPKPAATTTHPEISTRYAYPCNHRYKNTHANAPAIPNAIPTNTTNSFDHNPHTCITIAPTTFLT